MFRVSLLIFVHDVTLIAGRLCWSTSFAWRRQNQRCSNFFKLEPSMFVVVLQLLCQNKVGGWHNKLLVNIYDYDMIDMRWVVGLPSWWLSSTTMTKKRSSTGVNFILQFWGRLWKDHPQKEKIMLRKKTMIMTLFRADMLERTGILITEDMSRRARAILG